MDRASAPPHTLWRRHRSIAPLLLGLCGWSLGLAGSAHALGIDSPLTQSALGQALNLAFPVLLKPGEKLTSECVRAEVYAGEARVPPNLVQVGLEGESEGTVRAVRVYSPVAVNEPLVHVHLSVGCPVQLERQFTAFMDPPGLDQGARNLASGSARPPQYTAVMRAALAAPGARPENLLASPAGGSLSPLVAASSPGAVSIAARPKAALAGAVAPVDAGAASATPSRVSKPPAMFRSVAQKTRPDLAGSGPRLRLDAPDADEALASPLAQVAAAEVALLRLRQLEELLNRLQQDNQASRAKVQALRAQVESTPVDDGPQVAVLALVALSLGLGGLSGFLWFSRRQERAERGAAWWSGGRTDAEAAVVPAHASPAAPEGFADAADASSTPRSSSARAQAENKSAAVAHRVGAGALDIGHSDERTITLPPQDAAEDMSLVGYSDSACSAELLAAVGAQGEPGDVGDPGDDFLSAPMPLTDESASEPLSIQLLDMPSSFVNDTGAFTAPVPLNVTAVGTDHVTVEELIDLEQQVEFFLVLGQSDAAVELLQARIDFGGASALPYLKLMEIHQRQGDESRFHAVAAGFAKRFDALAPTWGADLNLGRDLEAYASDLHRIQQRWADAAASMALVQDLLSKGGSQGQGFDLPAYRELLFLYSIARDQSEHEVRGEEIDLFLPLEGEGQALEGQALMATMIWQGKEIPGPQHALEVDISLDDPNAAASRIALPGKF